MSDFDNPDPNRNSDPLQTNQAPVFQPPSASGAKSRGRFELRPYTVADILDVTFALMKDNWRIIGLATLVYALPAGILGAIGSAVQNQDENILATLNPAAGVGSFANENADLSSTESIILIVAGVLTLAVSVILQPLVQAAVTRLIAARFLNLDMSLKQAFKGARAVWLSVIAASILVPLATGAGIVLFLVGLVVFWVLFSAVTPAIVIEQDGVFNAMGRSWALMKRRFWGYLAIRVVVIILAMLVAIAVAFIPGAIGGVFYGIGISPLGFVFVSLGNILAEVVVFPIMLITVTLMYFDARVRFEGFDMQLMASRITRDHPGEAAQPPANDGPPNF